MVEEILCNSSEKKLFGSVSKKIFIEIWEEEVEAKAKVELLPMHWMTISKKAENSGMEEPTVRFLI